DPAIAAHLDRVVPFRKDAPSAAAPAAAAARPPGGPARAHRWLARAARGTRALRRQLRRAGGNGHESVGWTLEGVSDGRERVTHLFPNDCYVAHLSLYAFARPLVQGATVLDAGSGAGYGAAYLADHGARTVLAIDASAKAVAFSRHHFSRPNLRYEVMDLGRLGGLERGV